MTCLRLAFAGAPANAKRKQSMPSAGACAGGGWRRRQKARARGVPNPWAPSSGQTLSEQSLALFLRKSIDLTRRREVMTQKSVDLYGSPRSRWVIGLRRNAPRHDPTPADTDSRHRHPLSRVKTRRHPSHPLPEEARAGASGDYASEARWPLVNGCPSGPSREVAPMACEEAMQKLRG